MSKYVAYVGVVVEVEAGDEEEAVRLARHKAFTERDEYALTDYGVELVDDGGWDE